ncbi:MAG: DUF692 domain-containing protein [Pseudobdellovibrio sp.]
MRIPFNKVITGFGLRSNHLEDFLENKVTVDLFEVIGENYTITQGKELEQLVLISQNYQFHLHGVSGNIAGFDSLDRKHYLDFKKLADQTKPFLVSDHLCWNKSANKNTFELMPFPHTYEMVGHLAKRINEAQDILEYPLVLENVSSYFRFEVDEMTEIQFLYELRNRTNIQYLLDVNNLYVNSMNHKFEAETIFSSLDSNAVAGYHLAGHADFGTFLFDSHGTNIISEVWNLYKKSISYFGCQPTIIERDENIPGSSELAMEAKIAKEIMSKFEMAKS